MLFDLGFGGVLGSPFKGLALFDNGLTIPALPVLGDYLPSDAMPGDAALLVNPA